MRKPPKGALTTTSAIDQDKLLTLRSLVAETRDLETRKKQLEEDTTDVNKKLQAMFFKDLPDLMDEIGVGSIALEPEGNYPGVEAKAMPYYKANILASWPEEKREAAFQYLEDNGFGDLIKTQFVIEFPLKALDEAKILEAALMKLDVQFTRSKTVPWATLTAWLSEQVERFHKMPPLDLIGGTVGRVVKLKTRKDN